ncbi:MAG: IS200/IS605 family transposase [Ignavibacteriaceae bacterium]|nr:IS200/IS605 family transposase [Ignavibacteriaceae bacterium]
MPFTKIWIHLIWSTKNREKLINKELKQILLQHIKENARLKNIFIDSLNCIQDHIHLLISLGREQTISKIVMLIKGESSNWINRNKLLKGKFEWQDEYIAVSVSESQVDRVREYIKDQEEHHRLKSFEEEYNLFLKKYHFG